MRRRYRSPILVAALLLGSLAIPATIGGMVRAHAAASLSHSFTSRNQLGEPRNGPRADGLGCSRCHRSPVVRPSGEIDVGAAGLQSLTSGYAPSISLSPSRGTKGTQVAVSGTGFQAGESVSIKWNCSSATCTGPTLATPTADGGGGISTTITIPQDVEGLYGIGARGSASQAFAFTNFIYRPHLTLSAASGPPGQNVTVTGYYFQPNTLVSIKWSCDSASCTSSTILATPTTDGSGYFRATIQIPLAPPGAYYLGISDGTSYGFVRTQFTVVPKLVVSPAFGTPDTAVTISGMGYAPNEQVTVNWECPSSSCVSTTIVGTPTTDNTGAFSGLNFTIPAGTPDGPHYFGGDGASSNTFATARFVSHPLLSVAPRQGLVGGTVTVSGLGFQPGATVNLMWDCLTPSCTAGQTWSATADGTGSISVSVVIPAGTGGTHYLGASDGTGPGFARTWLTVNPSLGINPRSGPGGSSATVSGSGYAPNENVNLRWDCSTSSCGSTTALGTASTDSSGSFSVGVTIPNATVQISTHSFGATGTTSNRFAVTSYTVTQIKHVVIILKENHTFDNMFGQFPGANGTTVAKEGSNLVPMGQTPDKTCKDLDHSAAAAVQAVNGGQMNQFYQLTGATQADPLTGCTSGSLDVGDSQYSQTQIPLYWQYAQQFALADQNFTTVLADSAPNHLVLTQGSSYNIISDPSNGGHGCDSSPLQVTAASEAGSTVTLQFNATQVPPSGKSVVISGMTPSGYNGTFTITSSTSTQLTYTDGVTGLAPATTFGTASYSFVQTYDNSTGTYANVPPCFDGETPADEADAAGVSWKYYGPPCGTCGSPIRSNFDFIRHIRYGPDWSNIISNTCNTQFPECFQSDLTNGQLPAISWLLPPPGNDDGPGTSMCQGENWTVQQINAIMQSSYWPNTAIVLTWDDFGGWYDHVAPPQQGKYSLGVRAPLLLISPFTGPSEISHRQYDFRSVIRFMEQDFNLPHLTSYDRSVNSLANMFSASPGNLSPDILQTLTCPS